MALIVSESKADCTSYLFLQEIHFVEEEDERDELESSVVDNRVEDVHGLQQPGQTRHFQQSCRLEK